MANTTIALKKSATSSAKPTSLANGEIAINYADGILYYKHANGTIASISGSGASINYFGIVDANGTLLISDTSGDTVSIYSGDNITITGDAINDRMYVNANLTAANNYANAVGAAANAYALSISGSGSSVNVSTVGPTGNTNGTLWWNTNLGKLFIWYTDGDSNQWVEASPTSGAVDTATGIALAAFSQANGAYINANNAANSANIYGMSFANTKLANTTVTLAGSLTTTGAVIDSKGDTRDIPPTDRTSSMPYALTIGDTGKMVVANGNTSSTANVFVPNAIFAIGNTIMITNISTNTVTITQNSGVTMFLAGNAAATGNRTLAGKGIATIMCVGANNFIISGAGLT